MKLELDVQDGGDLVRSEDISVALEVLEVGEEGEVLSVPSLSLQR